MHYYSFNIGDYHSHTSHLDPLEDIAFRRMMDWSYLHERPLPKDHSEIGRLIRMRTHCDCIANVLREFFTLVNDGYVNDRIIKEVDAFKVKSTKAKASANARWHNKGVSDDANALRTHCEGNANHKPLTINHKPINNKDKSKPLAKANLDNVTLIFNYWLNVMSKPSALTKLTPKRATAIKNRLKDGYTPEQIKSAINGCSKDAFSMGQNDRNKAFNDIELICRTGEKLEGFIETEAGIETDLSFMNGSILDIKQEKLNG